MIVNEISLVIQNKNDIRKLMADKKTKESSKEDYKSMTDSGEDSIYESWNALKDKLVVTSHKDTNDLKEETLTRSHFTSHRS